MKISFCDLKKKDVINVCDGKNLGNIYDMVIDTCTGRILGIVLPLSKGFFNIFKSNNDLFIPYNRICKIGKDIILVDIIMHEKYIENDNTCECQSIENKANTQNLNNNIEENYNNFER